MHRNLKKEYTKIVNQANIELNIYQKKEERITEKDIRIDLHDISSKNGLKYECFDSDVSAYCIFTSGSTGIPKGVRNDSRSGNEHNNGYL